MFFTNKIEPTPKPKLQIFQRLFIVYNKKVYQKTIFGMCYWSRQWNYNLDNVELEENEEITLYWRPLMPYREKWDDEKSILKKYSLTEKEAIEKYNKDLTEKIIK